MTMIYGHKWTSNYGDSDDGTWLKGLHDVTVEQVKRGIEKCRISEEEWPPTLPKFRRMCLPDRVEAAHRKFLPDNRKPWTNPEPVQNFINACRALWVKS